MDKEYKIILTIAVAFIVTVVIGFAFGRVSSPPNLSGQLSTSNSWIVTATSSKETVASTTSSQILATSTSRLWANISNLSGTAITCRFDGGAPASLNRGILINASSTYEINANNLYLGSVDCISQGATANLFVESNQQ